MSTTRETAGIRIRPPRLVLAVLIVGLVLHYAWPVGVVGDIVPRALRLALGAAVFVGAGFLLRWAALRFRAAGTNVRTTLPSTALVVAGPYAYSRNPIYLAMVGAFAGVALAVDSLWLFGLLVVVVLVLRYGVIAREEAYLDGKFGDDYRRYKATVRRWI